jgi:F-type H+-transporting ATPase subunit b
VRAFIATILVLAQEEVVEENQPEDLYPHLEELIIGALAFAILFFFMWKWVLPRVNRLLEERRVRIQGELEKAEQSRREAEQLVARYEERLKEARGEANRIVEEARKTADSMRKDLVAKAEDESRQIVARAQQEIQAERDRTFEELRGQVGELSIEVASRVIGESLDKRRQARLVDEYIEEITNSGNGQREGARGREESDGVGRKSTSKRSSGKATSGRKGTSSKSSSRKSSSAKISARKRTPTRRKR